LNNVPCFNEEMGSGYIEVKRPHLFIQS
jgi:hypothetical protein